MYALMWSRYSDLLSKVHIHRTHLLQDLHLITVLAYTVRARVHVLAHVQAADVQVAAQRIFTRVLSR